MRGTTHGAGAGVGLSGRRLGAQGATGSAVARGLAGLAALTLLGLAACGSSSRTVSHTRAAQTHTGTTVALTGQPTSSATGAAAKSASGGSPEPPAAGLAALQRALAKLLAIPGAQTGAEVYDLPADAPLYESHAGVPRNPASVEKLYTSTALLSALGPDFRMHTDILGAGYLGPGGVWHGDLYLRGGGDPTFGDGGFNHVWEDGYGPTALQLALQLRHDGIRRVSGFVIGDSSLLAGSPGGPASSYAPDIPDYGGELGALEYDHGSVSKSLTAAGFTTRQVARTLQSVGVSARATWRPGITPPGAKLLASVASPPLSVLLRLMDVPSDDLFADVLTEQLGEQVGGDGNISTGAKVIKDEVATYGIHPVIVDGSGLSRKDLSTPRQIVDLLRALWNTPVGDVLGGALPTVGKTGTVQTIAVGTAATGRCVAKTGSLNYVSNLAGYCYGREHHQLIAFALFVDGPANWQAWPVLGKMVAAIARY